MNERDNCIFCKIVTGEVPHYKVWENEHAIAFLDIYPKVPGHTLIIPKAHNSYIFDMDSREYARLMDATYLVAGGLKKFTGKERVCVIVEGFEVPHVHVKLIPANIPAEFENPGKKGDPKELAVTGEKLKTFFSNNLPA